MNNIFISFLFTVFTFFIFGKIVAFALYEIKNENNYWGGICTIILTTISVIFSNIMVWIS